jgi:hypothetical protein
MANYSGIITSHGLAESKNNHTPSVKLCIKATTCLDDGNACDKTFYADLWLTDNSAQNTIKTLRDIGWQGMDFSTLNGGNDLEGVEVEITTEVETYEGNDYEKVRFVNKPGHFANRGVKAMDANQARAVVAKYNALLRNSPKPTATAQKPAQKAGRVDAAQYASHDEELPF